MVSSAVVTGVAIIDVLMLLAVPLIVIIGAARAARTGGRRLWVYTSICLLLWFAATFTTMVVWFFIVFAAHTARPEHVTIWVATNAGYVVVGLLIIGLHGKITSVVGVTQASTGAKK